MKYENACPGFLSMEKMLIFFAVFWLSIDKAQWVVLLRMTLEAPRKIFEQLDDVNAPG